jgi:hypothetical protein
MTDQHPITPPPELVEQWRVKWSAACGPFAVYLATQAARWVADQELEACIEWVRSMFGGHPTWADELRAARRPKPPTLKEQAMRVLVENGTNLDGRMELDSTDIETIRRALEALPND